MPLDSVEGVLRACASGSKEGASSGGGGSNSTKRHLDGAGDLVLVRSSYRSSKAPSSSPGVDTIALTEKIESIIADLEKTLPEGVEIVTLYRQRDFIDLSIGNLEEALRDGAIMVSVILFLFLFNFRVTFITLTAIPLSLAITIVVFDEMRRDK